jgi:hypothetical protein
MKTKILADQNAQNDRPEILDDPGPVLEPITPPYIEPDWPSAADEPELELVFGYGLDTTQRDHHPGSLKGRSIGNAGYGRPRLLIDVVLFFGKPTVWYSYADDSIEQR